MPSSRGSSWPRDWTCSSISPPLTGRFFTSSATWEAPHTYKYIYTHNIQTHTHTLILWEKISVRKSFNITCKANGNPLQYSCLENPRDRGAWWAAVYGVAQSRTRLKRLSSSKANSFLALIFPSYLICIWDTYVHNVLPNTVYVHVHIKL